MVVFNVGTMNYYMFHEQGDCWVIWGAASLCVSHVSVWLLFLL